MGCIFYQVFSGITTALGQPLGLSDCIFDGVRSCGLQARGFASHFYQPLSNVHGFPEETAFLVLFHNRFLLLRLCHVDPASPRATFAKVFVFSSVSWTFLLVQFENALTIDLEIL